MTNEPLPFDLKLAREAFATAAQLHGAATLRAGEAELAATLVETSFTTAGEELAAAIERSERR